MVTVSVVIPTYNRSGVISRAIDSALAQTLADLEVIVIDDASTDDTARVVESYDDDRLHYLVHDSNRGGSAARNTGIDRASGEYIAFLDSDDEWHPAKLEQQVSCLEDRSDEWGAVYCGFRQRRTNPIATFLDRHVRRDTGREGGEELLRGILLLEFAHGGASTLLVRSDVIVELDGFDETFGRHQDWEFLVRLLQRRLLAYVDATLVTKHDTGPPQYETVVEARQQYLQKFSETVVALSLEGYPILQRHRFSLSKLAFSNGEFKDGLSYLRRSSAPTIRDYLGLGWSIYTGLRLRG